MRPKGEDKIAKEIEVRKLSEIAQGKSGRHKMERVCP